MEKSDSCYFDLVIFEEDDEWVARGDINNEPALSGSGQNIEEAIGDFMINNRERLKFQYSLVSEGSVHTSTAFGRRRSFDNLGPNEKKFLLEIMNSSKTDQTNDR